MFPVYEKHSLKPLFYLLKCQAAWITMRRRVTWRLIAFNMFENAIIIFFVAHNSSQNFCQDPVFYASDIVTLEEFL